MSSSVASGRAAGAAPLFTVVVPTYERAGSLAACLSALAAQEFPAGRFEVVVVDDGGAVPPSELVARFQSRLDVRLITQTNAGPASARNAGAAAARGEYLAFTDDDCVPDARWLTALAAAFAEHPSSAVAVGGRVVNALSDGVYSVASQLLIEFLYEYYNYAGAGGGRFFITANLAVPAAGFRAVGGFDVTFPLAGAEDRDFCDRWRERGFDMAYADAAVVHHAHGLGLRSFCRQHFNYGRGAHYLHRTRARRGERRLRIEPLRFYAKLIGYPLSKSREARRARLALLLFLSQVTYGGGYFFERGLALLSWRQGGGRRRRRNDAEEEAAARTG